MNRTAFRVLTLSIWAWLTACGSSGGPGTGGTGGSGGSAGHEAGGVSGTGGSGGRGGSPGTGGSASGGVPGQAGQQGSGGSGTGGGGKGGATAGGGASGHGGQGTGGVAGAAATGGVTGSGGAAGQAGGGGAGAGGGAAGHGGAGGTSPCKAVVALDRSCQTAADCFAAVHQTNCCGQRAYLGLHTSAQSTYSSLEPQCEQTYPACGCAETQPTTDDGSVLRFNQMPGVACVQGVCTTFVPDCAAPCPTGTTCFSCLSHSTTFAACTTMCAGSSACHDASLPYCQYGSSGNTYGMYCTAADVTCDAR